MREDNWKKNRVPYTYSEDDKSKNCKSYDARGTQHAELED